MTKPITWFEIPALDLGRAKAFYEQILTIEMVDHAMGGQTLAIFPYDREQATGGCVVHAAEYAPSRDGVVVYLNAGDEIGPVLELVGGAGGSIALGRTELPPGMGVYAHIVDSEGNRVGLHAAR